MFHKILIANRGEIAVRIIRACKEIGIKTVAVYSSADKESLHTRLADEAVCIGPESSKNSYLNVSSIISAAEVTDAEAIHPGYGFLAENPAFAEVCENCGIKFIGPSSVSMRMIGEKIEAKLIAEKVKVPVLPWSQGEVRDEHEAQIIARRIGYPVMIKATSGGGGRGIKIVHTKASMGNAFHTAVSEAQSVFGDGRVLIEKFCDQPRHIEIQVMADEHENAIHLGERECSIQRRNQKILEEAPSSAVSDRLRRQMGDAALRLVKEIGYSNVGTVEFLLDKDKHFYFMEMNTRIQVEHPVTEEVTGIDLIKEQIRIAGGERLGIKQRHINIKGHSIECRINAEDPDTFVPSPGMITEFNVPGGLGVRVDSAVYSNYLITPHYDSMIAKLIVHAHTRQDAIERMRRALEEFSIQGIKTNIPLHLKIIKEHDFIEGRVTIDFLSRFS
ncbi:MAG: acetyl-CoA carboxylase biotin carboxylase subunit [Deltaproteobacteria bacterium]|nr:acetyl-CoA carboxylase biotin carboxylase subunit [Deltaproteobacteria bacterium]